MKYTHKIIDCDFWKCKTKAASDKTTCVKNMSFSMFRSCMWKRATVEQTKRRNLQDELQWTFSLISVKTWCAQEVHLLSVQLLKPCAFRHSLKRTYSNIFTTQTPDYGKNKWLLKWVTAEGWRRKLWQSARHVFSQWSAATAFHSCSLCLFREVRWEIINPSRKASRAAEHTLHNYSDSY